MATRSENPNLTAAYNLWNKGHYASLGARMLLSDESSRSLVADGENSPLGRLKAYFDMTNADDGLGSLLKAATVADPDGTRALLKEIVSNLAAKAPPEKASAALTQLAAYSGADNVEKAHAMLSATDAGFGKLSRHEQYGRIAVLLSGAQDATRSAQVPALRLASTKPPVATDHLQAIRACQGSNDMERAIAYLSDTQPGFKKLDWHRKNFVAGQYLRTGTVST